MSRDLDLAAADLLDRAADYIAEHGWTRGHFALHGRVCAVRAIERVGDGTPRELRLWAMDALHHRVGPIILWNDAQKSREPVLRTLREVAAEVRTRATDGSA